MNTIRKRRLRVHLSRVAGDVYSQPAAPHPIALAPAIHRD
jgi:hypothetical protein